MPDVIAIPLRFAPEIAAAVVRQNLGLSFAPGIGTPGLAIVVSAEPLDFVPGIAFADIAVFVTAESLDFAPGIGAPVADPHSNVGAPGAFQFAMTIGTPGLDVATLAGAAELSFAMTIGTPGLDAATLASAAAFFFAMTIGTPPVALGDSRPRYCRPYAEFTAAAPEAAVHCNN